MNNKFTYEVPSTTQFMTELEGIFNIPNYHCIVDKQLTGCGFTHWMINNNENVILCSPRKMLLENKRDQNPHVLYVKNEFDKEVNYEKELNVFDRSSLNETTVNADLVKDEHLFLLDQIRNFINDCLYNPHNIRPCKILVTYDSFRLVKEVLVSMNLQDNFRIVVDEFQSIFIDSKFKSTTEMSFLYQLQDIQKVCFVSATPMIEEYLDQLDEFKDLPFIQLDWSINNPMRVMKPSLIVKSISGKSISGVAKKIIKTYLDEEFEKTIIKDINNNNIEIESKECVIYVNSVKNIIDIIAGSKLSPDQVNILCSNTKSNQDKINKRLSRLKLGKYPIGSIPIEGEPHKMFTFCTRTVYLGADFYSTNARTFIFSDANIECLAVDITLDLPQILGRQRSKSNPWKNNAELYVKLLNSDKIKCKEEFDRFIEEKQRATSVLLDLYRKGNLEEQKLITLKFERDAKNSSYKSDYIAVDRHRGNHPIPIPNKLVMLSEKRAFDIQQIDYGDRFRMYNSLSAQVSFNKNLSNFFSEFESNNNFVKKMRLLCNIMFSSEEELMYVLKQIPPEFSKYYLTLGPERIKNRACNRSYLETDYEKIMFSNNSELEDLIYQEFKEGDRVSLKQIIGKLKDIYSKINNPNFPKAIELLNYFECKRTQVTVYSNDGTKKVENGYKLIKKLK